MPKPITFTVTVPSDVADRFEDRLEAFNYETYGDELPGISWSDDRPDPLQDWPPASVRMVDIALEARRPISAIAFYRQVTGKGLYESKEAIFLYRDRFWRKIEPTEES